MTIRHLLLIALFAIVNTVLINPVLAGEAPEHADEKEHAEEGASLTFDAAAREQAGIETAPVEIKPLRETIRVPAEVTVNAYRSTKITPRINAQIVSRHATLGDIVEKGEPLVTLSSIEVAEAQGALLVAEKEWQRVQSLGREVVSESRYIQAQVAHQQAHARLLAYGMSKAEIEQFKKQADATQATGRFDLVAPQAGRVISDDFIVGEFVEPGRVLFELTDESVLWVEASLTPDNVVHVEKGSTVTILQGDQCFPGQVLQVNHRVNETTRRQSVRIAVENTKDLLHPGEFVTVGIPVGSGEPALMVSAEAVVLVNGESSVFRLHEGAFEPVSIKTGEAHGKWLPVRSGLSEGDVIAVEGVFYLKSLLLKSSIGSGHGH